MDAALRYLRCPVCAQELTRLERSLRCSRGHSFDMARQGYADLTAGRMPHVGDTAEMVADRIAFLAAGHYDFIADALAAAHPGSTAPDSPVSGGQALLPEGQVLGGQVLGGPLPDGLVLDAGTGTGNYLARFLDAAPAAIGLGLDVSKPALRRAARAHPRAATILADLWRPLPIVDAAAAVILNVFAPRNGPEFHRVLRPDGVLLVVTPAPDHLTELITAHGLLQVDPDKAARVSEALGAHFTLETAATHRRPMNLTAAEARTLIGMTPNAHHLPSAALPTGTITVTAAVDVAVYRPVPSSSAP
ncbi:putative RNA methyltransferase [Micromonosporaceae bacterium Da 78-11]